MRLVLITLLLVACCATQTHAQSRKKKKQSREAAGTPTALDPYAGQQQQMREPKRSKRSKSNGPTYNAERNYYEHLEDLEKQKRKDEKEMAKPQNSNPMYFGHKRPPKKRPPNKMKFCKVCGIRH